MQLGLCTNACWKKLVFRSEPGIPAGKLIEEAGGKRMAIGGAMASYEHANFIVNRGDAKAADIIALIAKVQDKVFQKHGVMLQPEVEVMAKIRPKMVSAW